jgi:hypothetical protein
VFRFIIEYGNGFWPLGNWSIFIGGFLKDDILACVETLRGVFEDYIFAW